MAPTKRAVRRRPTPQEEEFKAGFDEARGENGDVEDEDETAPPKMRTVSAATGQIQSGWGPAQKQMDSTSSFAQTFKPDEKTAVIKFLEDIPYASFRRHWIERTIMDDNNKPTKSNRPYTCLLSFDKPCPLCEIGDKPQAVSSFNIAICDENGNLQLKSWDTGARLYNVLKSYANDPKIAPLTKGFFLVSRTGKKGSTQYNVVPVKATSLEEDYDTPVPTKEALDSLHLYNVDIVEIPTVAKLREIAGELMDDYE